jgi:ribosomal-protein-alanine N-acetyltransferase
MVKQQTLSIRAAIPEDYQNLANLIHFDAYVHRHLDYRPALDWIGVRSFQILEDKTELLATLACPPDPPQVAWVRLFAASYHITTEKAWDTLWPVIYQQLNNEVSLKWIAAIPLYRWFETLLNKSQFNETHHIVMLSWNNDRKLPEAHLHTPAIIRPMTLDDLSVVENVDSASFIPIWQNSRTCLEYAFRQASTATVLENEAGLVGYQISTPTPMGGHLARLAILPQHQGQGYGYALLRDLLVQFGSRGARSVTVNTQHDNLTSLALYQKAGFQPTSEQYPIFQLEMRAK